MHLTPEQQLAIQYANHDMVLLAEAGAGKTFVLTEIVFRLIRDFGVSPGEIVVVTFTEKAAGELKHRIASRLEEPLSFLEDCPIGTIHSFAAARLREGARWLPKDFVIWEENRSALERSRIVHQELRNLLIDPSEELAALFAEYGWKSLMHLLTTQLGMRWKLQELQEESNEPLWFTYRELYDHMHEAYYEHKRAHGALDFEDLEEEVLRLFIEKRRYFSEKYRHILVDEYQDISPPQHNLIHKLHTPGVNRQIIVGDPLQSIYRFRGAEDKLFQRARESLSEIGGIEIELLANFRSTPHLIQSLNTIFTSIFDDGYLPMRGIKAESDMRPLHLIDLPKTSSLTERRRLEAELIANHIEQMIAEGHRVKDFAILFRSRSAMSHYEGALTKKGIDFRTQAGNLLLEQQEVVDQINVFRALCCPEDQIALAAVMLSPLGGISEETLWCLAGLDLEGSLKGTLEECTDDEKNILEDFRRWWFSLKVEVPYLCASEVAHRIFQRARAKSYYEENQKRTNVKHWIAFLEWMETLDPFEVDDLLEVIEGFREDRARIVDVHPEVEDEDRVSLMTVHAAKGLEFPIVVVADLTASIPAIRDPILIDPQKGVGMRRLDPNALSLGDQMIDTEEYLAVKDYMRDQEIAESRRLLYVACTRAKECLILPLDGNRDQKQPTWNKWLCEALG